MRNLFDLKHAEMVISVELAHQVDDAAKSYFKNQLNDDRHVYTRHIFTEEAVKVYEAYTDSGSNDYLYLKVLPTHEQIIENLRPKLKFNKGYSDNVLTATDGTNHLTATAGQFSTLYILRDEQDQIIESWSE